VQQHLRTLSIALFAVVLFATSAAAQTSFDVATIRPSSTRIPFERSGSTQFAYGTLKMRDVPVSACIQLAYGIVPPLLTGPASLKDVHYDITAKADPSTTPEQMHLMLRTLLTERFHLNFHLEKKELRVYTLVIAPGGIKPKLHPSAPGGEMHHENSAGGFIGHFITLQEVAPYLSAPRGAPLTDNTGLTGPYDITLDFTPYVDIVNVDLRPDPLVIIKPTLKGELGLDMVQRKDIVDVLVVDHIDPPTGN
jgi:uncharacterized protein (TIGR03435 family)